MAIINVVESPEDMELVVITTKCPCCKQQTELPAVSRVAYNKWAVGHSYIQDAFPELNADEREAMLSGICPKCWGETFKED